MSKESPKAFDPKDRKILYTFWKDLPKMRIVVDYDDNFFSHAIRKFVFGLLGTGIKEEIQGKEKTRKALNAQEIFHHLVEWRERKREKLIELGKDFEPSLHSLYFHLQKLEEAGFIRTVAILREGRHNVTYYSRSAQSVFFKDNYAEDEGTKNAFLAMGRIAQHINSNFSSSEFEKFYKEYIELAVDELDDIQKKIAKYQEIMNLENIDPNDLQNFFMLVNNANPKFVELYKRIIEYTGVDLWE